MDFGLPGLKAVGVDLDGVIYRGNDVVEGAPEAVSTLKRLGLRVLALTNNSARTCLEISAKLRALGVEVDADEIVSSALTTALALAGSSVSGVAVVGSNSLRHELEQAGVTIAEDAAASALVVGYKPDFSYTDVRRALPILARGVRFVACNLERSYPGEGGVMLPGCGPGVMAIAHAASRQPDMVAGKPSSYFMDVALRRAEVPATDFMMVGDSWESDIAMAQQAGCGAVYVRDKANAGEMAKAPGVMGFESLRDWVASLGA